MNTFAVLSGDSRQSFINNYLIKNHFTSCMKTNFDFHDNRFIVCGTPFSKDGEYMNCDFYTSFPIKTFLGLLKKGQLLFGGNIPQWVYKDAKVNQITVVDVLKDKDVVWRNAMLTAEGLIAEIILHTNFCLSGSNVLILGFGRCGANIAHRLDALGCLVTIYDHTPEHLSQATSFGYGALTFSQLFEALAQFHIIINTVPCEIFGDSHMRLIDSSCVLFEIASKPYGFNAELAEKYHLSLITCPGLPGATAPKSAGEIIAKSIISYLERTGINGS